MKRLSSLLLAVALVLAAFAAMPEETQAAEKEVAVYVVSEMISILPDNSTSTPIVYTYTEKGLIKNKGEKDSYWKDKYTYNSDNRMKTFKEKSSTTPYKYYYKNGKLSKCKIYNWTTKYSYNKAGLLNEEKMYLNTDGKVYGSASYKYDSNGCVTSVESFQNGMNAKYTFKYDDFGNIKNSVIKSDTGGKRLSLQQHIQ